MAIERTHSTEPQMLIEPTISRAILSDCERYRYLLERRWDANKSVVNFVMLNPSTATESADDPTAKRCEERARAMGDGGFVITNLFALRATDPRELASPAINPIDDGILINDEVVRGVARGASRVICAWGDSLPQERRQRAGEVFSILHAERPDAIYHLGVNKSGNPKHPLYISYSISPMRITDATEFLRTIRAK